MGDDTSDLPELARELTGNTPDPPRSSPWPSGKGVARILESTRRVLFPRYLAPGSSGAPVGTQAELEQLVEQLTLQVGRALLARYAGDTDEEALTARSRETSLAFVRLLPEIQTMLASDVQAALDGDPALYSAEEAVLCYPGITAVICYRVAHALHSLDVPFLPRMMTEHAHTLTGIDIHPGARIGARFFIDHGTGVVIGESAVIGEHVRLYQGVTLGAKSFPADAEGKLSKGLDRHPILEDEVVVYSWASILGRVTIGRGSIIGGNVWVTSDVPPGSIVTQAQARQAGFADGAGI